MPWFTPPTHEEPIRVSDAPLRYYRLTWANSIVKVAGHYVATRTIMPDAVADLVQGSDYFIGGYLYEVSDAVAADLTADGFITSATPPNTGGGGDTGGGGTPTDPPGYGQGTFGSGQYGH